MKICGLRLLWVFALSYNFNLQPSYLFHTSGNTGRVKSLFHQQLNRERFPLVSSSPRRAATNDKTFAISKILCFHFFPSFPLSSSSSQLNSASIIKFIFIHDDDYVVIALPFDDVTDNLSLIRKTKTQRRLKESKAGRMGEKAVSEWVSER